MALWGSRWEEGWWLLLLLLVNVTQNPFLTLLFSPFPPAQPQNKTALSSAARDQQHNAKATPKLQQPDTIDELEEDDSPSFEPVTLSFQDPGFSCISRAIF